MAPSWAPSTIASPCSRPPCAPPRSPSRPPHLNHFHLIRQNLRHTNMYSLHDSEFGLHVRTHAIWMAHESIDKTLKAMDDILS